MNLFVLSDTHGKIDRAKEMFDRVRASGTKIDYLLHAGDYVEDAEAFQALTRLPMLSVPGNCDGSWQRDYRVLEIPSGRLLLTHGHMENIRESHQRLFYLAQEEECNAVVFGHTHFSEVKHIDGIDFVNPGSLNQPRDGKGGSCALIRSTEDSFSAEILYYNQEKNSTPQTPKKKARGGYLRSILNYSDGQ